MSASTLAARELAYRGPLKSTLKYVCVPVCAHKLTRECSSVTFDRWQPTSGKRSPRAQLSRKPALFADQELDLWRTIYEVDESRVASRK